MDYEGRRVLVAVSAGIAAYKACEAVSALVGRGCSVRVIMTPEATKFVGPLTFEALTGKKVYSDTFDYSDDASIKHIVFAQEAEAAIVAPATADVIAKMACGIADDMVSSTLLATTCPIIVCPAMHADMYRNPSVEKNLGTLAARDVRLVGPGEGRLASGDIGRGPLAPVDDMVAAVLAVLDAPRR